MDKFRATTNLRLQFVCSPYDDPRPASVAIGALRRANAMGLLADPVTCLDDSAIQGLEPGMAEAGIGQSFRAELRRLSWSDAARRFALLEKINEAFDQPPAPAHEWRALHGVLGMNLPTRLLGISQTSARRCISGNRAAPDAIAARLHFLALVVGDLAGPATISGSAAGSIEGVADGVATRPQRNSATNGHRATMHRNAFVNSPERSCHPLRRDRLPPRRSPLSILAGRFVAIRRPMERGGRGHPLFLRFPGWRLGGVPSPRENSRPRGSFHHPARSPGRRYRRSPNARDGSSAAGTVGRIRQLAGMPASRSGISETRPRYHGAFSGAEPGRRTRMAC